MPPNDVDADDLEPGERYGTTPALTSRGDLKLNTFNEFAEINDVRCVVQDLKVALMTPQGADPMRPEYGLDMLRTDREDPPFSAIGTTDTMFKAAIHRCIGPDADDRVQSIDDIEIQREGGNRTVTAIITITLEEGPQTSFEFYPKVLEES